MNQIDVTGAKKKRASKIDVDREIARQEAYYKKRVRALRKIKAIMRSADMETLTLKLKD